jgi:hypothetical protein
MQYGRKTARAARATQPATSDGSPSRYPTSQTSPAVKMVAKTTPESPYHPVAPRPCDDEEQRREDELDPELDACDENGTRAEHGP